MGLDLAPEAPNGAAAQQPEPETAKAKRERAPLDEAAREKNRQAAKVRRLLKVAKGAKSEEELWARFDELRGKKGEAKPEAQPEARETRAAVEPWKDPAALEAIKPQLAGAASFALARYPAKYQPESIEAAAATFADGAAPLALKLGAAAAATSPEAQAAAAVALVFGPPTLAVLWNEVLKPWWSSRKAKAAAKAQAVATVEGQVVEAGR